VCCERQDHLSGAALPVERGTSADGPGIERQGKAAPCCCGRICGSGSVIGSHFRRTSACSTSASGTDSCSTDARGTGACDADRGRRLSLRWTPVLLSDEVLRRGEVFSGQLPRREDGWQQGWKPLRKAMVQSLSGGAPCSRSHAMRQYSQAKVVWLDCLTDVLARATLMFASAVAWRVLRHRELTCIHCGASFGVAREM
jgi:hypothetical protein